MSKDKIKIYIIESILIIILLIALIFSNIFNKKILAILLVGICFLVEKIVNRRINIKSYKKQVDYFMIGFGIIYLAAFYLLGLYFGFYKAPAKFSWFTILNFILPLTAIIVSSEIIRKNFIAVKDKKSNILIFIAMVIVDLVTYTSIYDLKNLDDFLAVLGFILFASIACNLLYNYIAKNYGIKGIIYYRLLTALYCYFIPIIPDVYIFFRSFLRILYPYLMYLTLEYSFSKNPKALDYTSQRKHVIYITATITITVLLIMLVSCKFTYGILAIGSGSMTGSINKGDAIVYKSYDNDDLRVGNVIVFDRNDIYTVHRIIAIENVNGVNHYFTKGDANQNMDSGYVISNDIIGVYKFRIKYVGYPTLWIRDIFYD